MVAENDVLSTLQTLRWRGIEVPVYNCSISFQHEQSENKFLFRHNAIIDSLGRRNLIFRYNIPFREGIAVGGYKDLFTIVFYDFLNACRDQTVGKLEDPALGLFDAKCISWQGDLEATKRDGADVSVEFIHAPSESDVDADAIIQFVPTLSDGQNDARRLDDTVSKVNWKQAPPPEPTVNPLDAVSGLMRQGISFADRCGAAVSDTVMRANNILDALEIGSKKTSEIVNRNSAEIAASKQNATQRLATADQWLIRQQVMDLKNTLVGIEQVIFPNESVKIGVYTVNEDTAVNKLCADLKMTIMDFRKLNPRLSDPLIEKGTVVKYKKRA